MKKLFITIVLLAPFAFIFNAGLSAVNAYGFSTAKKKLQTQIYKDVPNPTTFYCGCAFDPETKTIETEECGYIPKNNTVRAKRIEWEHVVPASRFGKDRECWKNKENFSECEGKSGRACCRKVDEEFKSMEADLHNLQPAIGELNANRSNLEYGYVRGEPRDYGKCDFEIRNKRTEPRAEIEGVIGRIYKYMALTYGMKLTQDENLLMNNWDRENDPTQWECERNLKIEEIQGNRNLFIDTYIMSKEHSIVVKECSDY